MFATKTKPAHNLLELVPRRFPKYDVDSEGIVTIRVPRFKYAWMATRFVPKWKNPDILTRLDSFGSFVWQQIDGVRTVADIADALNARFGEEINPVYERLSTFIHQLLRRGFITLSDAQGMKC